MMVDLYVLDKEVLDKDVFQLTELVKKMCSLQNAVGCHRGLYAVRPVVAKTQESISRAFPS